VLALGMTFVIVLGSIDLSVEGVLAIGAVLISLLVRNNSNALDLGWFGVVLAILACGAIGCLNGVIHVGLRIPSFMVTLGMWFIGVGVATLVLGGSTVRVLDAGIRSLALDRPLTQRHDEVGRLERRAPGPVTGDVVRTAKLSMRRHDRNQVPGTLLSRIVPNLCESMFAPETTQAIRVASTRPESATASGAAPAPSATTWFRSIKRRTAFAVSSTVVTCDPARRPWSELEHVREYRLAADAVDETRTEVDADGPAGL